MQAISDWAKSRTLQEQRRFLPVYDCRDELLQVIRENQVVVVVGETGSGKTTQVLYSQLRMRNPSIKYVSCYCSSRLCMLWEICVCSFGVSTTDILLLQSAQACSNAIYYISPLEVLLCMDCVCCAAASDAVTPTTLT